MAIDTAAKRNAALLDQMVLLPDGSLANERDRGAQLGQYVSLLSSYADMVVEISLSNIAADTDAEVGVNFRKLDASNFLAAYVDDGDNLVHLAKFLAGVETTLGTAAWTPADTAEIRVLAQSDRLRVEVDRVLKLDVTEADLADNARAGLFSRSTTVVLFKDFYAEGL